MDFESRPLQVSEITELIKSVLESGFREVYVEGEISNFRPSSTGHWYFSLKDMNAMIQAVMFKNRIFHTRFRPEDGMLVRVRGSVSLYAQRGSYQIICEHIEAAGQGRILAMLEKRKQAFAAEGLF
ncbi:MAG: exodeoxyribonuclease VII large subunit, partial [Spirochaetales bacterium]|nr:exodeoxyribonuclease VII large subunit [Spirochaetales bacterium]